MLIIKNCQILNPPQKELLRGTIIIEGETIKDIVIGNEFNDESGVGDQVIDAGGKIAVPGLIDVHVHLCLDSSINQLHAGLGTLYTEKMMTVVAMQNAQKYIKKGITTIRDLGDAFDISSTIKSAIKDGFFKGPRIFRAGKFLTSTGGHGWTMGDEIDSKTEMVKAVRKKIVKDGVDVIKLIVTGGVNTKGSNINGSQFSYDEIKTAVDLAHDAGIKVAVHAIGQKGISDAAKAGVDSIEHGHYADEEARENMLEKNIFYVPTLCTWDLWQTSKYKNEVTNFFKEKNEKARASKLINLERCLELGIKIAAGSDGGITFVEAGSLSAEIIALNNLGMSPENALAAATSRAAELLGADKQLGQIKKDYFADLLLFNTNPLNDLSILNEPMMVVKGGNVIVENCN